MKVLVLAHRLELGGTQVNAIELAASIGKTTAHEIALAAVPGPALGHPRAGELDYRPLPPVARHPSLQMTKALGSVAEDFKPDLVHVWDWPQAFDAYPGLLLRRRIPMLCSVMDMTVSRNLPRQLPTTFGTRQLAEEATFKRRGRVHLLEPPVDIEANHPGVVDGRSFRDEIGVSEDEILVTVVSRLEAWMKLESLDRAVDAVARLSRAFPIRLAIVGDGSARIRVDAMAESANAEGRNGTVTVVGPMIDPRRAYAGADIVVGMGGSALRAMAFGKPLVVVGENGFSQVLDAGTLPRFLYRGWYGLGSGVADDLAGQLRRLVSSPEERVKLGELGLRTVQERYTLDAAAHKLASWYVESAVERVDRVEASAEGLRSASLVAARALQRTGSRWINSARGARKPFP